MPKITILPHADICPDGIELDAPKGKSIIDVALDAGIDIEHACEKACACTTCHIIVRDGFNSLKDAEEEEEDMLDKAWGLEPESRLGCQALVGDDDLIVEIPKYTINMVSESH